ncbi:hypothetical protein GCM10010254_65440 [Streptomyces chromofuscus]|nr:hypothetical protein GCM10010254_65440 [Streptomyces chromofuscus]
MANRRTACQEQAKDSLKPCEDPAEPPEDSVKPLGMQREPHLAARACPSNHAADAGAGTHLWLAFVTCRRSTPPLLRLAAARPVPAHLRRSVTHLPCGPTGPEG